MRQPDDLLQCGPCKAFINESFEFMPYWWAEHYSISNGYFGSQDELDDNGAVIGSSV